MTTKPQIMVVEDEPEISRFLESALEARGYGVTLADNGRLALKISAAQPPDLLILDLGLPDMDGKDIIKSLREWSRLPIIVLSARDQEDEKVAALEIGADDYLTKPFGTAELMARITVALRHAIRREAPAEMTYSFGDIVVDLAKRHVMLKGEEVHFTPTEYSLLAALVRKAGQVVTQAELLQEVWGRDSLDHDHYLRIYVQKLRQKLGDNPLKPRFIYTEPGIGYRLSEEEAG
ncbi:MAG: DNA-binding response regulator [Alphaproteobacteria bacterium]|jgi:two-component system KDP operon response regulator KdpE|nr:DNA-binding response regulator [Alphaproteobacteria bacterium]